jgi:hypothetical protein
MEKWKDRCSDFALQQLIPSFLATSPFLSELQPGWQFDWDLWKRGI